MEHRRLMCLAGFYETVLGYGRGGSGMTAAELVEPWERAFQPGGCTPLPPYTPPP